MHLCVPTLLSLFGVTPTLVLVGVGARPRALRVILFVVATALLFSIGYGIGVERRPLTFSRVIYLSLIIPLLYANAVSTFHRELLVPMAALYGGHHVSSLFGMGGAPIKGLPLHPLRRVFDC